LKECHTEQKEEGELLFVGVIPLTHLQIGGSSAIERCALAIGEMLRVGELASIKTMSTLERSTVFLWELRKAMATGNKKALATTKANISSLSVFERQRDTRSEAHASLESPELLASKRKADELSSSVSLIERASNRPTPGHLFQDGSSTQSSTSEQAVEDRR
jgi:hypothetical protein